MYNNYLVRSSQRKKEKENDQSVCLAEAAILNSHFQHIFRKSFSPFSQ